uniref:Ferredoxin-thioredoxin reductase, catalytic chain n=1 Tax=Schizocladia ischiensis TaxID=196139 RepID=A0A7U3NQM0_9STRA|nr:ftrC [Schizocladia ischiensis]QOW07509.1 ftrC [Schizocladia ischiensis]
MDQNNLKFNKKKSENLEAMRKFAESYAKRTNTVFCSDVSITACVINALAENKNNYGSPLCPCRQYDELIAEVDSAYWNCPCVPMRERKECHCTLFLVPEDEFAATSQTQTIELKTILKNL